MGASEGLSRISGVHGASAQTGPIRTPTRHSFVLLSNLFKLQTVCLPGFPWPVLPQFLGIGDSRTEFKASEESFPHFHSLALKLLESFGQVLVKKRAESLL